MNTVEALEKGKLIKNALKIVDELAENDLADLDQETYHEDDFDVNKLQKLIIKARDLKRNRWWKLT